MTETQIDVREVARVLTEHYGINAGPDNTGEAVQVYIDSGFGAVMVEPDGNVTRVRWDNQNGAVAVVREEHIKHVVDEDGAVRAVAGYMRRREIGDAVESLRRMLDEYVPGNVVDYRVECPRDALRLLAHDIGNVRVSTDPSA